MHVTTLDHGNVTPTAAQDCAIGGEGIHTEAVKYFFGGKVVLPQHLAFPQHTESAQAMIRQAEHTVWILGHPCNNSNSASLEFWSVVKTGKELQRHCSQEFVVVNKSTATRVHEFS